MLAVFYGDNADKRGKAVEKFQAGLKDVSSLEKLSGSECTRGKIEEAINGTSLFGGSTLLVLEYPLSEGSEEILSLLPAMQKSSTQTIIIERTLSRDELKTLKKHADEMEGFELLGKAKVPAFNTFAFADALGKRDKKGLWILLEHARAQGISGEEIHGILFWQMKTLLLMSREEGKSATDLEINPFVYRKAQGFLKHYTPLELQTISSSLISALYVGRMEGRDSLLSLEKFFLSAL